MPIRSGGSYVLRGGKPALVSRSGHGGDVSPDEASPRGTASTQPAAVVASSAPNVKKEKADAHTPKNAPSRT